MCLEMQIQENTMESTRKEPLLLYYQAKSSGV